MQDQRQQTSMIDNMTADSAQFSGHGMSTTVNVSDESSLTMGRSLSSMTAHARQCQCTQFENNVLSRQKPM